MWLDYAAGNVADVVIDARRMLADLLLQEPELDGIDDVPMGRKAVMFEKVNCDVWNEVVITEPDATIILSCLRTK
jgi:hypothetical protein